MGWIESGVKCEIHRDECQQPGVCSSCLRERLSLASTRSFTGSFSSSSSLSSSPPYSTVSYFSATNSPSRRQHHRRWRRHHIHKNGSAVMSSISYGLKKSKSIAAGVRRRNKADDQDHEKRDKKTGFWSKIITGKKV